MKTLEELYEKVLKTTSDINQHVPKLRDLASQCDHVTEFGMRLGVSTVAILAGQPKKFITHDINYNEELVSSLAKFKGNCDFSFVHADVLKIPPIDDTDMLFIDTIHNANQLTSELSLHANKVRRWIVLHDTTTFGNFGEGGGEGLEFGLNRWLADNPLWKVSYKVDFNNGLTVVSK